MFVTEDDQMDDVPPHDQLMWPTLNAVRALGGSATIGGISRKVIEIMEIPEHVQDIPHKSDTRTKLEYRLAWARTYLKRAAPYTIAAGEFGP